MQCKEWDDANSELFKESHDEAVHKNSYKSRLYELISASLGGRQLAALASPFGACGTTFPPQAVGQQTTVKQSPHKVYEIWCP